MIVDDVNDNWVDGNTSNQVHVQSLTNSKQRNVTIVELNDIERRIKNGIVITSREQPEEPEAIDSNRNPIQRYCKY